MASNMKLQLAAAVCLILLVVSEMPGVSGAAACDIFQMMPCVAASKNGAVKPSTQCCTNVGNMGRGITGARCLCSLLTHPLAKSQGVVPRIALAIPQKCGIPVPRGFVCQGMSILVPACFASADYLSTNHKSQIDAASSWRLVSWPSCWCYSAGIRVPGS
jgi:hypothetical protein